MEIIKDRLDIAEIVGERVVLKKAGLHFKGLCPFHQEKTPSFIVSPSKGIWHCFGCNKGGDVISFVQAIEQVEFREALQMLATRAGVELKKQPPGSSDKRQRLYELLEWTARFYHELLINQKVGNKSKEYLMKRGVKEETIKQFSIGYAPKSWDTLQNFLRHKGFSPREMLEAGVAGENSRGTLYDRFRGRIIFPIQDIQDRVVAFGGRIVPWHATGEEGKYVNSPESSLYEKRRVVYNLNRAKDYLRQRQPCIVVEGYMDVVMMVQSGVRNVVASSGTAFTTEALRQISRLTNDIHFLFDGDAAGVKAATAATLDALTAGMKVGLVLLPGEADPADMALADKEQLLALISKPQSIIMALMNRLKKSHGPDIAGCLDELLPIAKAVTNPVHLGEMVQEIAQILHVPEYTVIAKLDQAVKQGGYETFEKKAQGGEKAVLISPEQQLIGMVIAWPNVRPVVLTEVKEEYILVDNIKALYNVLHRLVEGNEAAAQWSADELIEKVPEEQVSLAEGLRRLSEELAEQSQVDVEKEVMVLVRKVKRNYLERELAIMQQRLAAEGEGERSELLGKFKDLRQELSQVSL